MASTIDALVRQLRQPEAYPHPIGELRTVETHVSYLFFTGDFVYKVKKPVDYGFLDFTTLEKRWLCCLREIEFNSRLSPDVYLEVTPIRVSEGRYKIGGPGKTVEYAVKMRQLSQDTALDTLLDNGCVSEDSVRRIASRIADFHANAATGPNVTKLGDLAAVRQNVDENFEQTSRFVGITLTREEYDDLQAYSRAFMNAKQDIFICRAKSLRIRDGHGDLHAANIFVDDEIHFIDCIEFNDRFRCADVAEDIAFLAMDFDHFGYPELSRLFLKAYVEASGDRGIPDLLDFFKIYRACVRGKVTSFRLDDASLSGQDREQIVALARSYFALAHSYMTSVFPRPSLVMVTGLMGSGKTSISQELARRWGMTHISSDETRKRLSGVGLTEHRFEDYGRGMYSPEFTRRTYDAMYELASERLLAGESVVIDATFRKAHERREAVDVACAAGAETWIVECAVPDPEIERRLRERANNLQNTVSDGRWELYQKQKREWEPIAEVPPRNIVRIDTSGEFDESVAKLLETLFERSLQSPAH